MRILLDEDVALQALQPLRHVLRNHVVDHVRYRQRYDLGLSGLALALGALISAMPFVIAKLMTAGGQRLVRISSLDPGARYQTTDPQTDPPKYWPR